MSLLFLLAAQTIWEGAVQGAIRGAIGGAIVGGLVGLGVWVFRRLQQRSSDSKEPTDPSHPEEQ